VTVAVLLALLQVYSLVVGAFRASLSASLVEAARAWGAFSAAEADRLAPLVDSLPSRCALCYAAVWFAVHGQQ
jgi:hypothetical protein